MHGDDAAPDDHAHPYPPGLRQAAIVDGCGYTRIFLPHSLPVLAVSADRTTLAVAVATDYVSANNMPLNNLMAAGAVMYIVPVLLLFLVLQRGFVAGVATSGLK